MHSSRECALNKAGHADGNRVLIVGVNWIGDSVMAMPALQAYRRLHPAAHIALLVKPPLAGLWKLHAVPNQILILREGFRGTLDAVRALRAAAFDQAFVLPHSFRSSFIPWLARIPIRQGMPGHWRDAMLTSVVHPREERSGEHQAWEYMTLLCPEAGGTLDHPALSLSSDAIETARTRLAGTAQPLIGLIPGAARGPSKEWPTEHFIELGRALAKRHRAGLVVMGGPQEVALCTRVAEGIGRAAVSFAGKTNLPEWIALLKVCDTVVANDSGGMHLAAAVGTPVVALYGITDPSKTGPLGRACRILQQSTHRSRDVARDSAEARTALAAITPEQAFDAVTDLLAASGGGG